MLCSLRLLSNQRAQIITWNCFLFRELKKNTQTKSGERSRHFYFSCFSLSPSLSSFRLPRILLFLGIIAIFSRAESAFPGSTWRKIWPSNRCNFQNSFQLCYKKSKISSYPCFPFFYSLSLFLRHFSKLTWTGTKSQVARHKVNRVPLVHCNSSTTWDNFYPRPPLPSLSSYLFSSSSSSFPSPMFILRHWHCSSLSLFAHIHTHEQSCVICLIRRKTDDSLYSLLLLWWVKGEASGAQIHFLSLFLSSSHSLPIQLTA